MGLILDTGLAIFFKFWPLVSQDMTVIIKISKDMIGGDEMLLDVII